MPRESHGRILSFSSVDLSITSESRDADHDGASREMGREGRYSCRVLLEMLDLVDAHHQLCDLSTVYFGDI